MSNINTCQFLELWLPGMVLSSLEFVFCADIFYRFVIIGNNVSN